jgi:hypothetical protein
LTLWPVFLESVVQEDSFRLFELDDVVTLPVVLVDVAKARGWPAHLGVQTTVTPSKQDGWVTTADGLSCHAELPEPMEQGVAIRFGLDVPMMIIGPFSFVTGTVRRIELASVAWPEVVDPDGPVRSTEQWTLTETPVAPVSFRHGRDPLNVWDRGMVVHLELLTPRCRCREFGEVTDPEGLRYARRHLREVAVDIDANTAHYVCPNTGAIWLWHRWKRKRAMEHMDLKLSEPMLLTPQQLEPDLAASQPLPSVGEFDQISPDELTGSFRDVAQLNAEGKRDLERAGIQLVPSASETADPLSAAAVQLRNGSQYMLIEHLAHPERFIDLRAQTSAASSKLAARQLLAAAGVPDARLLWLRENWLA